MNIDNYIQHWRNLILKESMENNGIQFATMWKHVFNNNFIISIESKDIVALSKTSENEYNLLNISEIMEQGNNNFDLEKTFSQILTFDTKDEAKNFLKKFPIVDNYEKTVNIPWVGDRKIDFGLKNIRILKIGDLKI